MGDDTQCARCGVSFAAKSSKRYCSEACRSKAEKARYQQRYREKYRIPKLALYHERARASGRPERQRLNRTECLTCGTDAGMDWWVGRHAPKASGASPNCAARCQRCYNAVCAERYHRRKGVEGRGSVGPRWQSAIRAWHRDRDKRNAILVGSECIECHSFYFPNAERRYNTARCEWCAEAHEGTYHSVAMRRRRAAERNGDKGITWRSVAERDGWGCHLCGGEVEQVGGTAKEPRGATVDHLTPIALGGPHTWDNVALAHRLCNVSRGAKELSAA
jgi:5-methylcytosine-specific restriction endonuclease McrA